MSQFDRAVGRGAGWVFWGVIGPICLCLKLYHRMRPRQAEDKAILGGQLGVPAKVDPEIQRQSP